MNARTYAFMLLGALVPLSAACERAEPKPEPPAPVTAAQEPEKQEQTGQGAAMKEGGLEPAWELSGFKRPESVLYDAERGVLYVSNVDGVPDEKDGKGFISRASLDGEMIELEWVTGLDAPKGMARVGGRLYVSNIVELAEIDIERGELAGTFKAQGAKFLNDVTADSRGNVYVSDMMGDAVWRLSGGAFEKWLESPELMSPNGLYAEDGRLVVACWGERAEGFGVKTPGRLKTVTLQDKSLADLGSGAAVGSLDGLEPDGAGNYYATDWSQGKLYHIKPSGEFEILLDLGQGSADLEYVMEADLLIIPMMNDGKISAYKVK